MVIYKQLLVTMSILYMKQIYSLYWHSVHNLVWFCKNPAPDLGFKDVQQGLFSRRAVFKNSCSSSLEHIYRDFGKSC